MYEFQNTYYFGTIDKSGYELYRSQDIQRLIDTGKGVRVMKNMTRKYYVDDLVQLCKLLRLFFEQAYEVSTKRHTPEMTVVKKYENVFESMVDALIGDDLPKALKHLKNQRDGKTIDHIYQDLSLIHNDNEMNIYYIGDSKYYKESTKLGTNSVAKQFTYAKNVIQYCINIFNKGVDTRYQKEEENIKKNFAYRDDLTEGYNITPNFFIHGRITPEILADKSNFSLYGTNAFHAVWEEACAVAMGNILHKKLRDIKVPSGVLSEYYRKRANDELIDVIEKPTWFDSQGYDHKAKESLIPDIVSIHEDSFYIFDAKYYNIRLEVGKNVDGQPGIGDITKQYLYQLAYKRFCKDHGFAMRKVRNSFLMPIEKGNCPIKIGSVRLDMLSSLKLKNSTTI